MEGQWRERADQSYQLIVNSVGFMISEEDLTSRPGARLDHSRAFV